MQNNDWLFVGDAKPTIVVDLTADSQAEGVLKIDIETDIHEKLYSFSHYYIITDSLRIESPFDLVPGFYCVTIYDNDKFIKQFNIGYKPELIASPVDCCPDFKKFWNITRAELDEVDPQYKVTYLKKESDGSLNRNIYMVTMQSWGGETISGYLVTPKKKGKYPAIITYMGYGSDGWVPAQKGRDEWWIMPFTDKAEYVEFLVSVRGQGERKPENRYGDWITYNLNDRDNYYYRGAFMDLVRAVDFVVTREEVDTRNIFAEGGSQGGALTLAACALDRRITAAAPYVPFLSDYPDYFKMVEWPAKLLFDRQAELNLSDSNMYTTLSYFDIKNLAQWIECPILMGVGLQDATCPPHTNFAVYNNLRNEKKYVVYPDKGHDFGSSYRQWWSKRNDFFNSHLR